MPAGLQSFPVSQEVLAEGDAQDEVELEVHRDEDVSIKVTQKPGYPCHIEATAAFRMPAETLYKQVITHPDNAAIFRHLDRCTFRKVVRDDGKGRRQVKVAHEASWRFLMFRGAFTTKLDVVEDDTELAMDFVLDPSGGGVVKKFNGRWKIRPHPKDPQRSSLSTLDQELALGIYMPPPFDKLLKRISCNQVKKIFEDVKKEANNVNRGKPTLCPWEEVRHKEFGEAPGTDTAGEVAKSQQHGLPVAGPAPSVANGKSAVAAPAGEEVQQTGEQQRLTEAAAEAAAHDMAGMNLRK